MANEFHSLSPGLLAEKLRGVKKFKYERVASLGRLLEPAENHHYSTLWLYSDRESGTALGKFQQNIRKHFPEPSQVWWSDENLLLVIEKRVGCY